MLEQLYHLQRHVVKRIHSIKAIQFQGLRSKYSHTIILSRLLAFVYDEYPCIVVGDVEWNTAVTVREGTGGILLVKFPDDRM